jgi:hypothetical protein
MARKVRRVRRTRKAKQTSEEPVTVEKLREEYAYVLQDLRTIFILAAAMFLLLILLNLVI